MVLRDALHDASSAVAAAAAENSESHSSPCSLRKCPTLALYSDNEVEVEDDDDDDEPLLVSRGAGSIARSRV